MYILILVMNIEQGVPDLSDFGDVQEVEFGSDQLPISAIVKKEFQRKIIYNMSPLEVILLLPFLYNSFTAFNR